MLTITKRLTKYSSLGLIRQEIDQFMDEEQIKRQQFYEQITEDDKAEFINGQIIMHSPVKDIHATVSFRLASLLEDFVSLNRLGLVGHEKRMVRFTRNDYEPDIIFFHTEKSKHFTDDQMLFPVPDFIVEVLSKTTESTDRNIKFYDYAEHGVGEYWMISTKKKEIEKYVCKNNKYKLAGVFTTQDVIISKVVSGFEIDVNVLFDDLAYNELKAKDKVIIEKLSDKILQKEKNIEENLKTIKEKDKTIEEKDKAIEEKDKTIEEKDKAIELLKLEIAKLKK